MKSSLILVFICSVSLNFIYGAPIDEGAALDTFTGSNNGDKLMPLLEQGLDDESKEAAEDETHDHDHSNDKIDPILNQEKDIEGDKNNDTEIEGTTESTIERKKRQYYDHSHCYHDHCHDYYSDGHSHVRYGGWGRRRWNFWG